MLASPEMFKSWSSRSASTRAISWRSTGATGSRPGGTACGGIRPSSPALGSLRAMLAETALATVGTPGATELQQALCGNVPRLANGMTPRRLAARLSAVVAAAAEWLVRAVAEAGSSSVRAVASFSGGAPRRMPSVSVRPDGLGFAGAGI